MKCELTKSFTSNELSQICHCLKNVINDLLIYLCRCLVHVMTCKYICVGVWYV